MLSDLRHGLRVLLRAPRFTLVAVSVLTVGLAANAAVFSLVSAVLFHQLPVPAPERLRFLFLTDPGVASFQGRLKYGDFLTLEQRNTAFTGLAAHAQDAGQIRQRNDLVQVRGEAVSGNYFAVLGVQPRLGRFLDPQDNEPSSTPAIVLAHGWWRSRFNGDPAVIGATVLLDGIDYTIVGVAPPGFTGTISSWQAAEYWTPLVPRALRRRCATPNFRDGIAVSAIGRLRPDATDEDARAMVSAEDLRFGPVSTPAYSRPTAARWRVEVADTTVQTVPFDPAGRIVPSRLAAALLAMSGVVLLIAIVNLIGLSLARTVSRRSELAVRMSLGATPWRLGRQLAAEGLLLAGAAALVAMLLVPWLLHAFRASLPRRLALDLIGAGGPDIAITAALTGPAMVLLAAMALAAGLLVGLGPLRSVLRHAVQTGIAGEQSIGSAAIGARRRYWNVVPQLTMSLALLMLGAVLVRHALAYRLTDSGYDRGLVFAEFYLPPPCRDADARASTAYLARRRAMQEQLLHRARHEAALSSADMTNVLPFVTPRAFRATVVARPEATESAMSMYLWVNHSQVTSTYFKTAGIPLVAGRELPEDDAAGSRREVVVSTDLARRLWGDRNPVGQALAFREPTSAAPPVWWEVVGVAGEVAAPGALGENPIVYSRLDLDDFAMALVARPSASPHRAIAALREAVGQADPQMQLWRSGFMQSAADDLWYPQRLAAALIGWAALVSLALASIGLYGLVSYSVAQRTREMGVRAALGADPNRIIALVVGEGALMVGVAGAAGIATGLVLLRLVSGLVTPLPAVDAGTSMLSALLLAVVALVACYLPARRAAAVDPTTALRSP